VRLLAHGIDTDADSEHYDDGAGVSPSHHDCYDSPDHDPRSDADGNACPAANAGAAERAITRRCLDAC